MNKKYRVVLSVLGLLFFSLNSFAGIFNNLESLLKINQENYKVQYDKIVSEQRTPDNFEKIKIDQDYLSSILFYTPKNILKLGEKDVCSFYDLLLAGLLKDNLNKEIETMIITQGSEKYAIAADEFIKNIASKECPNVENFKKYFSPKNISKTLKNFKIKPPTTRGECRSIHKDFTSDYKSPYLCSVSDKIKNISYLEFKLRNTSTSKYKDRTILIKKIKEAKSYKAKLNGNALLYIGKLCLNTISPELFCKDVFQNNFWTKILSGEKSPLYAASFCNIKTNNYKKLTRKNKRCILSLESSPQMCSGAISGHHITPSLDCTTLAKTLNTSKLRSDYIDCPLKTNSSSVTTVGRILNHYKKGIETDSNSCMTVNSSAFLRMLEEEDRLSMWGFNLCFEDKIKDEKDCSPVMLGNNKSSPYSLNNRVKEILVRTKGMLDSTRCTTITKKEYKPILLRFKAGCFVIIDKGCDALRCKPKVIFDELEMKHIEVQTGIKTNYYASKFNEVQYSLSRLLTKNLKLKIKKIFNITTLKEVLDKSSGLIHGVGCGEDLLPTFFPRKNFASCNPLSFIVDGYVEKDGYLSVSIRTSYDSLQLPRLISWGLLFSSLKTYKSFQPIQEWSLDGIY